MGMRKLVGRNFARLRREKGLTQEDVGARSGCSQQYLSDVERGCRNPTVITLFEFAQALAPLCALSGNQTIISFGKISFTSSPFGVG